MIGIYSVERIQSLNGTLSINRSLSERDITCDFSTKDDVQEWDEIIVENRYMTKLYAGIADAPELNKADRYTTRKVKVLGYRKIFDRLQVADNYESMTAGAIIRSMVAEYCPGFTTNNVADGATITRTLFNYALPSEVITKLAGSIGYDWYIDFDKDVHFFARETTPSSHELTSSSTFERGLKIRPRIENFANVVVLRGGTYRSSEQVYKEKGDGVKTQFILPEKPHDVRVEINSVEKTDGIKFGENTPTTDFVINFNEKYIENGLHAVLSSSDEIAVYFTYDVPLRIKRRNAASIEAMKARFPELAPDGEFQRVIHDKDINDRDVGYKVCEEYLNSHSNLVIEGDFATQDDIFTPGELLNIDLPEFTGSAVIQKVRSRQIAGTLFEHTIEFATVLFGFEDFLRDLLAAKKIELKDGEVVETLYDFSDVVTVSESVTVTIDSNRQNDAIGAADTFYSELNKTLEYVLTPYFPSSFADSKRAFNLDLSPLA